tara:strand:+ start:3362 stop:4816 length:1455 start_codon:yes stop_codon:yes gene_type:complete
MKKLYDNKVLLNLTAFSLLFYFCYSYISKLYFVIGDRDEIAYLSDSILLIEGIQPSMSHSPGGLSVWIGAFSIVIDFLIHNFSFTNIENIFNKFDLTLYKNYKDLSYVKIYKYFFNILLLICLFYLDKKKLLFFSFFALHLVSPIIYEFTFSAKPYFTASILFFISFLIKDKNKIASVIFFGFAVAERLEFALLFSIINNENFKFNFKNNLLSLIAFVAVSPWFTISIIQNIKVLFAYLAKDTSSEYIMPYVEIISPIFLLFYIISVITFGFLSKKNSKNINLCLITLSTILLILFLKIPFRWLMPGFILITCHINDNIFKKFYSMSFLILILFCISSLINFNLKNFISDKEILDLELKNNYQSIISRHLLIEELNFKMYDEIFGTFINQQNIKNIKYFGKISSPLAFGNNGNLEKRYHRRYEYLAKYNKKKLKNKFIGGKSGLWFTDKEWCQVLDKEITAVNDLFEFSYLNQKISLTKCSEIN